MTNNLFVPLL